VVRAVAPAPCGDGADPSADGALARGPGAGSPYAILARTGVVNPIICIILSSVYKIL